MSSIDVVLDEESSLEDAPSAGGGPPGGGPPAPPGPPGPPAPPGPLAKAALKTPCSSVAWSLVSLPEETSPAIKSSIFDLSWSGDGRVPLAWSLARLACIAESISVRAADKASLSDELMAPELTSESNSSCNFCSGDW